MRLFPCLRVSALSARHSSVSFLLVKGRVTRNVTRQYAYCIRVNFSAVENIAYSKPTNETLRYVRPTALQMSIRLKNGNESLA